MSPQLHRPRQVDPIKRFGIIRGHYWTQRHPCDLDGLFVLPAALGRGVLARLTGPPAEQKIEYVSHSGSRPLIQMGRSHEPRLRC